MESAQKYFTMKIYWIWIRCHSNFCGFLKLKSRQIGPQANLIRDRSKKNIIEVHMFPNLTWILVFCQFYETVDATDAFDASCIIGCQIAPNSPSMHDGIECLLFLFASQSHFNVNHIAYDIKLPSKLNIFKVRLKYRQKKNEKTCIDCNSFTATFQSIR